MSGFDDIDTPATEEELLGEVSAPAGDGPADPEANDVQSVGSLDGETDLAGDVDADQDSDDDNSSDKSQAQSERAAVIPRARFDEVNARLHAEREARESAERRIAELESAKQTQEKSAVSDPGKPTDSVSDLQAKIDSLENDHYDAMFDGDRNRAVQIRREINTLIEQRAEQRAMDAASKAYAEREQQSSQANEMARFNATAAEIAGKFPILDINSPQANNEAIESVVVWRDHYISKGKSLSEALTLATDKVVPMFQPSSAPVSDERTARAVARNVAAASAQPAPMNAGIGNRAAPPSPKIENQSDWEKLTDKDRETLLM